MKLALQIIFASCALWFFVATAVNAELEPAKEAVAQEIFGSVMSPYCVARSLRDCPSSAARELQQQIRGKLAAGKSKDEIFQELYATYGQKIRSTPDEKSGLGLLGWLAPAGFAVLGIVVLAVWLARRKDAVVVSQGGAALDPQMEARIKDELSKF